MLEGYNSFTVAITVDPIPIPVAIPGSPSPPIHRVAT